MSDKDSQLGIRVVRWARNKLRKRVGRGECWDLADQALRAAGAQSSEPTGKRDEDYVWGKEISLLKVQPGDILQFRSYVAKADYVFPSGADGFDTLSRGSPNHTAIVGKIVQPGLVYVFEQNIQKSPVQRTLLYLRSGEFSCTGAPKFEGEEPKTCKATVKGTIRAYRPVARRKR